MDKWAAGLWKLTKPVITLIGFLCFVALVLKLGFQFGDRDMAMLLIGEFIGVIITIIGFWFKERSK